MARSKEKTTIDLLQDIMIIQLGLAGVPQLQIRKIVGVDVHRVNNIVKYLNKKTGKESL
jgi:hypothetical protein